MNENDFGFLQDLAEQKNISDTPAKDFMSRDVMTVQKGYTIKTAIEILKIHRISGIPVVDEKGKLIGIISSYDLLLQAASRDLKSPIQYNAKPFAIREETPLKEIIVYLHKKKFRRLPVVDKNLKVTGIVSRIDVLSKLTEN